jgi:hypothetical protein
MTKPPTPRTIEQRMREARRIGRKAFLARYANGRGSDNWYLDHEGVHYDIKALWASAHRPPVSPASFQTYDAVAGFKTLGFAPLSGVSEPHGLPGDRAAPARRAQTLDDAISPLFDLIPVPAKKHFKPTGYWLFLINPARWDPEGWRATGERELLYLVSKDDERSMQRGDLGLLRVNRRRGAPATFIAAVEVLSAPTRLVEPDTRFFSNEHEGAAALRARLSVITPTDLTISAADFPDDPAFRYIHDAVPRTTIPVDREAFLPIARALGLTGDILAEQRAGRTTHGVHQLEADAASGTPTRKERVSKVIERGPIGQAVKAAHKGRCQICVALGQHGAAFVKPNGDTYAEAHHVIPVSTLTAGALSHLNIMVLCPNHHRQTHYGHFDIVSDHSDHWIVAVDRQRLRIDKTRL